MMNKMQVYNHLPIWIQNLVCCWEGRKIKATRYGDIFEKKLSEYEERDKWSYEQKREYRDEQLRKMIHHCYDTVPYYHNLFNELHIKPDDIQHLDDLKLLPILTKDIINENPEAFISSAISQNKLMTAHTSGTTGTGFIFKTTQEAICEQWAVWWRYRRAIGIKFTDWCAMFGGRSIVPITQVNPPFFRWNKPCKQLYFSTYHMNDNSMPHYIYSIKNSKVNWIHGYPSAINILADYMIQNHQKLNIKYTTTGAENLLQSQKEKIKIALGHVPYEHYGLSEGTANFSENKNHIMFVDEDFAATEFITNEYGTKSIIGTTLTNFAMPFVRYNTGDVCKMEEIPTGRVIKELDGRKEDYLVLRDGTKVGRLDHIFKDMINVREAQFIQKEPGIAKLRIVRNARYNVEDESLLKAEIYSRLKNVDIRIEYVSEIARTKTGKFRFVVAER